MITEDYVTFETAKLLKENGFDWSTLMSYDKEGEVKDILRPFFSSEDVAMPTLQMAMKWLREKHIVIIPEVETFYADGSVSSWEYHIWCDDNYEKEQHGFSSYEGACEAAIKYCLENFI